VSAIEERVAQKKAELDRLRPISGPTLAALADWYDVELTYTSNAIEGNTLTRSETAIVLEKGITIGGKPLKDHLEAIGHKDALDYVRALADRTEPLREINVREIHRLVVARVDPNEAGRYSQRQRMIAGSTVMLPSPAEIPALMGDMISRNGSGTHRTPRKPRSRRMPAWLRFIRSAMATVARRAC
jgi:Fic family protein